MLFSIANEPVLTSSRCNMVDWFTFMHKCTEDPEVIKKAFVTAVDF